MSCFTPVAIDYSDPQLTFYSSYKTGVFLLGSWDELPQFSITLQIVGTLQALFCVYMVYKLSTYDRSHPLDNNSDTLQYLWQSALASFFIFAPHTAFSGVTMGFIFLHSIFEFVLLTLRLQRWFKSLDIFPLGLVLLAFTTMIVILSDNPIIKGIATSIPAVISDLGNPIVTIFLYLREGGVREGGHAFFALMHIVIFFPHLAMVCYVPSYISALYVIFTITFNLLGLFVYSEMRREVFKTE